MKRTWVSTKEVLVVVHYMRYTNFFRADGYRENFRGAHVKDIQVALVPGGSVVVDLYGLVTITNGASVVVIPRECLLSIAFDDKHKVSVG
jgi:hypothetical protein